MQSNWLVLSEEWIYKNHDLNTTEEKSRARNIIYECAKNLTQYGYPSFYGCFDSKGRYNNMQWSIKLSKNQDINTKEYGYILNKLVQMENFDMFSF